jgi:glycosyltransferase involved in cell wall biosynthesis
LEPEGPRRAPEYSSRSFSVPFAPVSKRSPKFALQLAGGLFSPLPLAIGRWRSPELRATLARLLREERYDAIVCDFLVTAVNFPQIEKAVLFQHNVESIIWKRHADTAASWARKKFFRLQEERMFAFERDTVRRAAGVIAVSDQDSQTMRDLYGVSSGSVPTGVNVGHFRPPEDATPEDGLVFVGSMDWLPNIDGVRWFAEEVLPLIRASHPSLPVTIVGRMPPPEIRDLALRDPYLRVTGTVPDVRPYLWNARVSIVPLRIGGGTRLKIYEAMAAGTAIVSTTVGAEGLDAVDGETIALADDPREFARRCLNLMTDRAACETMRARAMDMVASRYSWRQVTERFERLLTGETAEIPEFHRT